MERPCSGRPDSYDQVMAVRELTSSSRPSWSAASMSPAAMSASIPAATRPNWSAWRALVSSSSPATMSFSVA